MSRQCCSLLVAKHWKEPIDAGTTWQSRSILRIHKRNRINYLLSATKRRIKRSRRNVVEAIADSLQRNPKQKLHHLLLLVARGQELLNVLEPSGAVAIVNGARSESVVVPMLLCPSLVSDSIALCSIRVFAHEKDSSYISVRSIRKAITMELRHLRYFTAVVQW